MIFSHQRTCSRCAATGTCTCKCTISSDVTQARNSNSRHAQRLSGDTPGCPETPRLPGDLTSLSGDASGWGSTNNRVTHGCPAIHVHCTTGCPSLESQPYFTGGKSELSRETRVALGHHRVIETSRTCSICRGYPCHTCTPRPAMAASSSPPSLLFPVLSSTTMPSRSLTSSSVSL